MLPLAVAGVVCSAAVLYWFTRPTAASLLAAAREAAALRDDERVLELTARVLERDCGSVEALLLAAKTSKRMGDPQRAIELCRRLPEGATGPDVVECLKDAGQRSIYLGRARDAEHFYERASRLVPDDLVVRRRLSALYLAQSRRWESAPHLFALLRGQAFTLEELAFLGNLEEVFLAEELMALFEQSVPEDLAPLMGRARIHLFKNFPDEGEALLRRILAQTPELIEAQAQLGVVLVSESRDAEWEEWHSGLPAFAEQHPEIWWVRGTHARKHGDSAGAMRCGWEALRLDPNHLGATYQVAQLLAAEGQSEQALLFAERAAKLESLCSAIHEILLRAPTAERMLRCARLCEDLGRPWEAWGWHVAMDTYHPEEAVAGERARLKALLEADTPQTLPSHCLADRIDLSHYPLPRWDGTARAVPSPSPGNGPSQPQIEFEDIATAAGLNFQYENGAHPDSPGLMIYQSIGGGVAVIDYDCDGAPDLYFPQAGRWPPEAPTAADRLYRTVAGQCRDVTGSALAADSDFGFGAAIGDWNVDGLPDVYVANVGQNRLLLNNGDGTFSNATDAAGLPGPDWTVSCLIADVNGDGLPDLFDVNYCAGDGPLEHMCHRSDGRTIRTCIPTEFHAADDRLLINLGNGCFEEVGARAGIHALDGRGLGIVAANLDAEPGLDLYIANDMTANFLYLNRTPAPGALPRFEERGVVSGTAYDSDGRPQASMGIAADDADGDGLLDLFVTNFYNESSTFYRQRPGGFFIDDTRRANLRNPRLDTLGWGTQFLDVELDGLPDLVVANGHVDDFTEENIPFHMQSQFFSNRGKEFVEIPAELLGPFFVEMQLGRGLARLDWNRDGRDDFVVSRLFAPAALLVNHTAVAGRFVAVRLVGQGNRDAIGAEVRVHAGGRVLVKQLTAGDGFAASNQRQLVFGLAHAKSVDGLRVRWPGGFEQDFGSVPIDCELLLVEGFRRPLPLPVEQP
jgi:tetratricopeptide (TPR) repeat protein